MNNGKRLMLAVKLYAGDNNDFYPPNEDNASGGWLRGNLNYSAGNTDNTNIQNLINSNPQLQPALRCESGALHAGTLVGIEQVLQGLTRNGGLFFCLDEAGFCMGSATYAVPEAGAPLRVQNGF